METKIVQKSRAGAFRGDLGASVHCRLQYLWGAFWDPPERRKSCSRYNAGLIAPGVPTSSPKGSQNRDQKPPWRLQDGFKTCLKKGFDFGFHFKALFVAFGGPRGGVKMASKIASKTALALKLGFSTPILSPSGLDFGASGS